MEQMKARTFALHNNVCFFNISAIDRSDLLLSPTKATAIHFHQKLDLLILSYPIHYSGNLNFIPEEFFVALTNKELN